MTARKVRLTFELVTVDMTDTQVVDALVAELVPVIIGRVSSAMLDANSPRRRIVDMVCEAYLCKRGVEPPPVIQ